MVCCSSPSCIRCCSERTCHAFATQRSYLHEDDDENTWSLLRPHAERAGSVVLHSLPKGSRGWFARCLWATDSRRRPRYVQRHVIIPLWLSRDANPCCQVITTCSFASTSCKQRGASSHPSCINWKARKLNQKITPLAPADPPRPMIWQSEADLFAAKDITGLVTRNNNLSIVYCLTLSRHIL